MQQDPKLFLGFLLDIPALRILENVDPKKRALLIRGSVRDPLYLQIVSYQNTPHLGKCIGEISYLEELSLLEQNILTLLAKLSTNLLALDPAFHLFPIFDQGAHA